MHTINLKKEWGFIIREINAGNKSGSKQRAILFQFQILLSAFSKAENQRERQMLASIFQEKKWQYKS